jgi:hypothetical protein
MTDVPAAASRRKPRICASENRPLTARLVLLGVGDER